MSFESQVAMLFKMLSFIAPMLAIALAIVFLMSIPDRIRNHRLKKAGILDTDKMSGIEFENWLKFRFEELGYRVKTTPRTGDGGADLILIAPGGKRRAVQAKKSAKQNIGVKAVGEAMRGQKVHGCHDAMVVTNQYYTKQAKHDAEKCGVELWNRDRLLEIVEYINRKKQQNPKLKKIG